MPRPAPPPPRPRQKQQLADPPPESEPVDLTEFAHSERQPALLEPDDDERTLARPLRASEPELSSDTERPFALVNPPLPSAEPLGGIGGIRELAPPKLSTLDTPPTGTESISRSTKRGSSGLLLGFSVLSIAIAGLAVFFRSGQAAKPDTTDAPRELAPAALAEPPEGDVPSSAPAEPEPSAARVAIDKAAPPPTTVVAKTEPAPPRLKPAVPAHPTQQPASSPAPTTPARAAVNPPPRPVTPPRAPAEGVTEADAPFDRDAAASALAQAAQEAAATCRKEGDPAGTTTTTVTFAPSGRVTTAILSGPPFAGTQTGSCIAATLRRARIPAFTGDKVTVGKTIIIR